MDGHDKRFPHPHPNMQEQHCQDYQDHQEHQEQQYQNALEHQECQEHQEQHSQDCQEHQELQCQENILKDHPASRATGHWPLQVTSELKQVKC